IAVVLARPESRLADFADLGFDLGRVLARFEAKDRTLTPAYRDGQRPIEVLEIDVRLALVLFRLTVADLEPDRARVEHPVVDCLAEEMRPPEDDAAFSGRQHFADDLIVILGA